jgi:Glycosyl hydrolase family 92
MLGDRSTTESAVRTVLNKGYGTEFYAGDEDNGEQGAWFVLSALGLFSAAPGSDNLVLGSPLFKHVRLWRGKCTTTKNSGVGNSSYGEFGAGACDYSDLGKSSSSSGAANPDTGVSGGSGGGNSGASGSSKSGLFDGDIIAPHEFPPHSSYLDIVALGTSPNAIHVEAVTLNGAPVGTLDNSGSPGASLRGAVGSLLSGSDSAAAAAAAVGGCSQIKESLLHQDGVLRFVMEGERIGNVLPPFSREHLVSRAANSDAGGPGAGPGAGADSSANNNVASVNSASSGKVKVATSSAADQQKPQSKVDFSSISDVDSSATPAKDKDTIAGAGASVRAGAGVSGTDTVTSHLRIDALPASLIRNAKRPWLAFWEVVILVFLIGFVVGVAMMIVKLFEQLGFIDSREGGEGSTSTPAAPAHKKRINK